MNPMANAVRDRHRSPALAARLRRGALSRDEFEERLQRMHDASLNAWLETPEGIRHCVQIGRNPE